MRRSIFITIGLFLLISLIISALNCGEKTGSFTDPNLEKALIEVGVDLDAWPARYYTALFITEDKGIQDLVQGQSRLMD